MVIRRRLFLRGFALVVAALTCSAGLAAPAPKRPKLLVVVVVDQMRADYLTRFAGLYTGGFRRFNERGAVFADAHHEHALTLTAAGHATISTGSYPSHHGVVANDWYDRDTRSDVYAAGDPSVEITGRPGVAGASPHNLALPALGDWLKIASPASRVYSVAFKDRSSVLMGGSHPDGAYWYDDSTGRFVTSTYYSKSYPAWVDAFNASGLVDAHFAEGWKKLLDEDAYFLSTEDRVPAEADGEHTVFPYVFDDGTPGAKAAYHKLLWNTPFGDELAIEFARRLVASEHLGKGDATDVLWLSCSTADSVGHRYGPLSQEAEDTYLRLDRSLERLFADLDAALGPESYVVALSADHGVLPLPEELVERGVDAGRIAPADFRSAVDGALADVAKEVGATRPLGLSIGFEGVVLDVSAAPVPPEELRRRVADRLRKLPFVADAFTLDELTASGPGRDYLELYRHSTFVGRTPDVMLRNRENWLVNMGPHGTTHGSPYRYDTHVPLVFMGEGIAPGRHAERAATVDLAPTMAELAGIKYAKSVDGRSLADEIRSK